jgi:hypothetical protein
METARTITLRDEKNGRETRHLWASVDDGGNLHIDGQDLGPAAAMVSDDGEYEWFQTIRAEHLPRLLSLLGAGPGDDILDVLEGNWSGPRSYELERLLRESDFPMERHVV